MKTTIKPGYAQRLLRTYNFKGNGTVHHPYTLKDYHELLNPANFRRPINDKAVRSYAMMMKAGKWDHTDYSDPITFDSKGGVVAGYHRLAAVVKSSIPLKIKK